MLEQDAAKARIKTIEGKMLGLMHRLNRYRASPNSFFPTKQSFNASAKRPPLSASFHAVGLIKESLEQQINTLRSELYALQSFMPRHPELRLTA